MVIVKAGKVETPGRRRMELRKTNWPNVKVTGLTVNHSPRKPTFYLFSLLSAPQNPSVNTIGNISKASVSFKSVPRRCEFKFSNYPDALVFDNPLKLASTHDDIKFSDIKEAQVNNGD